MVDVVSPDVRSRMMAGIRGKDTKPELLLRSALHQAGFRFKLHERTLPGRPDLVFPRYGAVLFVHGCFWHGHRCHLFKWPSTRAEFWREKISRNKKIDKRAVVSLRKSGWRIGIVWECALKGRERLDPPQVIAECTTWLRSDTPQLEIRGRR